MNIFGYDKLWGPSQRVVTLFTLLSILIYDVRGCSGKLAGKGQVDLASKDRMEVAFSNYSVLILYVLYHIIYSDTICHTIFERYAMVRRYFYKGISRWQDNCAMSLMQV